MRESAEVREIVSELENAGFNHLYDASRKIQRQLYTKPAYANELSGKLADEFDTRIPAPSPRVSAAAWDTEGILRREFQLHVEPNSKLDRDERKADRIELALTHLWAMDLNTGGKVMTPTHRWQTVGPYALWWLEYDAFALPVEEDAREKYRKHYMPFKLSVINSYTAQFLTDDDNKPTLATRHYELPYIRVVERYGKDKDGRNALSILNEQFPYLRGGRSTSAEAGDLYSKRAKVWVVDDGNTQCHYIEAMAGAPDGYARKYEAVTDDCPNPFGRVPLFIVTGRYNADAEELVDRYQGLVVDLAHAQRIVDVLNTQAASIALTPSKWAITPTAEQRARSEMLDESTSPRFNDDGFAIVNGDIEALKTPLPPEAKELLAQSLAERDAVLPAQYLTHPDPVTLKGTVGHAHLTAVQTAERAYTNAIESQIAAIKDVFKCIEHFICHAPEKGQPAFKGEKLYVQVSGREPTKKAAGHQGELIGLVPEDFAIDPLWEISPLPKNATEKQLQFDQKFMEVQAGVQTHEDLVEVVTEDVTGTIEKLEEERRYQKQGPIIDQLDLIAAIETIRLKYGRDYSSMLLQSGALAGAAPVENQPPPTPATGNGMRYDAPAIPSDSVTVRG